MKLLNLIGQKIRNKSSGRRVLPPFLDLLESKSEWNYNETEMLLWSDVKFTGPDSVLIHITVEKSRNIKGAFIDLFKFSGHNCCPVSCLKALYDESKSAVQ